MADHIKVDTVKAAGAAKTIADINSKISNDFSIVDSAMKSLNQAWDGQASASAISAYHKIKSAYFEPRYEVVQNFVTFLHQQVDDGYSQTEIANLALEDMFK